jgi:hypothetical protein
MTVWWILISAIGISWIPFLLGTLLDRSEQSRARRKGAGR